MSKFLVVVDMQNDFIDGALGTLEAIKIVPNVIEKINQFQGSVVYTQDTHQIDYLSTQEGHQLPVLHCVEKTSGWEIQPQIKSLQSKKGSSIFKKETFGSKQLAQTLSELHKKDPIESIELIGLCTDICVISNALTLKAFLPETPISVDAKCCAGVTPQSHANALQAMKMCQIHVTNENL